MYILYYYYLARWRWHFPAFKSRQQLTLPLYFFPLAAQREGVLFTLLHCKHQPRIFFCHCEKNKQEKQAKIKESILALSKDSVIYHPTLNVQCGEAAYSLHIQLNPWESVKYGMEGAHPKQKREKNKKKRTLLSLHTSVLFFSLFVSSREKEKITSVHNDTWRNQMHPLLFSSVYVCVCVCVCIFKSTAMKLPSCVLRVTLHRKGKQKKKKSATLYMETTKIHQFIEKKKRGRMKRQVMH